MLVLLKRHTGCLAVHKEDALLELGVFLESSRQRDYQKLSQKVTWCSLQFPHIKKSLVRKGLSTASHRVWDQSTKENFQFEPGPKGIKKSEEIGLWNQLPGMFPEEPIIISFYFSKDWGLWAQWRLNCSPRAGGTSFVTEPMKVKSISHRSPPEQSKSWSDFPN